MNQLESVRINSSQSLNNNNSSHDIPMNPQTQEQSEMGRTASHKLATHPSSLITDIANQEIFNSSPVIVSSNGESVRFSASY